MFTSSDFNTVVPGFYNEQPTNKGVVTQMNLNGLTGVTGASVAFGVKYQGYINITTAGDYHFYTNSNDGSNLYIDGSLRVSNDGSHAITEVDSGIITLSAGLHSIEVNYFQSAVGTASLSVSYSGPSIAKQAIPASILSHSPSGATGDPVVTPPALTYTWTFPSGVTDPGNSTTINANKPGTYTVTGSNGGCSSIASFEVKNIDSYDYSDLNTPWPVAQAKVTNCISAGVPTGSNNSVWAGSGVSIEPNALRNATASIDTFDDGLIRSTSSANTFNVTLNSNTSGTTVYYGLWFDWNNNGNFSDDVDGNGASAFYSGSGVTASPVTVPVSVIPPVGATGQYTTRLIVSDKPVVFTAFDNIFDNGEVEDSILVQYSLSGTVFDDANGLTNSTVNGTGTNAGGLTAILVNSAGNVAANTTVAANGTYSFSSLGPDTYSIVLNTAPGVVGSVPPSSGLPANWVSTGENLGAAVGNDGTVNGILTNVVISTVNVTNANFGINTIPLANPATTCQVDPGGATKLNVPILTGSDAEDGNYDGSSNNNKIIIATLPANGILYYNNVAVTAGQLISNYNPTLLTLDPNTGADIISFTFSEQDAAGNASLPATVTVSTSNAGIDQAAFQFGSATMAASGTGTWTEQAGNPGNATITTPTSATTTITGFSAVGNYTFIWTNTNGCTDTAIVNVTMNVIDAVADTFPTQTPSSMAAITVGNVSTNDTMNGFPVTATNTDVTPVTTGPLSVDAAGVLTLAPNTPSGSYTITYSICEVNPVTGVAITPSNCDSVTDTIVVSSPIDAVADTFSTQIASTTAATTVGNVTTNDTLNGVPVTSANTDVTPVTTGPLSVDATGVLTLAPNTPSGSYTITYSICEVNPVTGVAVTPLNCDSATDTIVVLNPIDAVADAFPKQMPTTTLPRTIGNVTTNDTFNGTPITSNNSEITPVTSGPLSIDDQGVLTLAPNTPVGSYPITYSICEVDPATGLAVVPSNCDSVTDTIIVSNPGANLDVFPTQTPSTTVTTTVGNVRTNDTLDGMPATAANTDITPVTAGPLTIDDQGFLTLAPNTPSGSYPITYTICATATTICDSETDTIVVLNPIDAIADVFPTQTPSTTVPTTVGDVTANDTLNGVLITAANTDVTPVIAGPISIDATGILTLAPNTPSGSYPITYTICEVDPVTGVPITPSNCDSVTDTIVVSSPIDAVADVFPTQTPSTTVPTTVGDVTANDTLNGVLITAANTDVTPVIAGPISIDAAGILTLAPNTPSGSYPITYTICEVDPVTGVPVTPSNCDSVTDTIVVSGSIDAVADVFPTQTPGTTVPTTVGDVTANDTLNGVLVTAANTDVTPITAGPLSIDAAGSLTLAPNTPSGSYPITYTICEVVQ